MVANIREESFDLEAIAKNDPILILFGIESSSGTTFFQTDESIRLYFSNLVVPGSGEIVISNASDTRTIAISDVNQISFDEDNVVTINPATEFVADTTYTLQIASGVIVDTEGNIYEGSDGATDLSFTTIAATNPQLLSVFPRNGATEVWIDQAISLSFDEAVRVGTGNIVISNGTDIRTIAVDDSSQVNFFPTTAGFGEIVIRPMEDLLGDTTYSIQIADGVITDKEGNAYTNHNDVTFATVTTAPELLNSNPVNHSTMKTDASIELHFDRIVVAGLGDIIISNGADTHIIALDDASQVTFDSHEVIINPTEDLLADTTYTVQMAKGAIVDKAGHDYAGFKDATVTILPPNPTLFSSSLIQDPRLRVDDNIKFFFDEQVIAGEGNIIISNGIDTRTIAADDTSQITFNFSDLIINPAEDLLPDTTYTIQIEQSAVTDLEGHAYAGISDIEVTPIDSNPFITRSNLQSNSALKIDKDIELFFNEDIELGSGNIVLSNGSDTRTITMSDTSQVSINQSIHRFFNLQRPLHSKCSIRLSKMV